MVNARALMNFISLRNTETAQREIRRYAEVCEGFLETAMPVTHGAFVAAGRYCALAPATPTVTVRRSGLVVPVPDDPPSPSTPSGGRARSGAQWSCPRGTVNVPQGDSSTPCLVNQRVYVRPCAECRQPVDHHLHRPVSGRIHLPSTASEACAPLAPVISTVRCTGSEAWRPPNSQPELLNAISRAGACARAPPCASGHDGSGSRSPSAPADRCCKVRRQLRRRSGGEQELVDARKSCPLGGVDVAAEQSVEGQVRSSQLTFEDICESR